MDNKTRIEKEAIDYVDNSGRINADKHSYIAGATAEQERSADLLKELEHYFHKRAKNGKWAKRLKERIEIANR